MKLIEPYLELKDKYIDYIEEWEESGEKIIPYASTRRGMSYEELLSAWVADKTDQVYEKGFVPATIYFLVDDKNNILGTLHFRHELNDMLLTYGGHIGYGIRPSERRKGYATLMLKLALEMANDKGYEKVLITCDEHNIGSARTIEKNGGVLENIVDVEDEGPTKRYWILLSRVREKM